MASQIERDGTDREGDQRTGRERQNENREDCLYKAAFRGDLVSLQAIIAEEECILDKVLVGGFKGKNPLNVAIATGQENIVRKLLEIKPELAEVLDAELRAALHVACSKGNLEIVKLLVGVSPGMCLARDREGNNPLHVAAMKGKVDVLKTLLQTRPNAARVTTDRGDNILHLCVNYNQIESLKLLIRMVRGQEFFDSTDASGNNILHLAVFCNQFEIIKYLLECPKERADDYLQRQLIDVNARNGSGWMALLEWPKERKDDYLQRQLIDVNARNGSGWTALDILSQVGESKDNTTSEYPDIKGRIEYILRKSGVKKSYELFSPFYPFWQKKEKDTLVIVSLLMAIVSLLMAMMSFQVGINPPGGVWQDTSAGHEAGKAVIAYTNPKAYSYLVYFNTIGFLLSLTTILELIVVWPTQKWAFGFIRAGILWLTIMIMAFTYTFSVIVLAPTEMYMSINLVILVTVTVWAVVIPFHRVLAFQVKLILITALMAVVISFWCMGAPTSRPKRRPTERTTWN